MGPSVHDQYEPHWWHCPVPRCEPQSLHPLVPPLFLLPRAELCWKGHYLQGCLPETGHRVSTATWVNVQARVWALTQIQEDFYPFPSPLTPPSAQQGPGHSTASHRQRACVGRRWGCQSWEEGAGRDFLRQRIHSPAIRGKQQGNLSCSLRVLGN